MSSIIWYKIRNIFAVDYISCCKFKFRIETSAVVDTPSESREIQPAQTELLSSKSDELVENPEIRQGSNSNAATKLVTVIATSFTFVAKTLTSTATLAAAEGLLCRPPGYAVC